MPRSPARRDRDRDRDHQQPRRREDRYDRPRDHDRSRRDDRDRHDGGRRYNDRERSPRGDRYRHDRRDRERSRDRRDGRDKRRGEREVTDERDVKRPRRERSAERRDLPKRNKQEEQNCTSTVELEAEAKAKAEAAAEKKRKYAENLARLKAAVNKGQPAGDAPKIQGNEKEAATNGSGTKAQASNGTNSIQAKSLSEKAKNKKPKVLGADFKPTAAMTNMASKPASAPAGPAPTVSAPSTTSKVPAMQFSVNKAPKPIAAAPVPMRKGLANLAGEEKVERKKFVPLPEMTADDAMDVDGDGEDSDGIQDDDDEAAGYQAAADERARAVMATAEDSPAPDGLLRKKSESKEPAQTNGETDEVDPLDAYMVGIETAVRNAPKLPASARDHVPRVYQNDDLEVTIDAVGDAFDNMDNHRKKSSKKKDLAPVNHSKMDYPEFRKKFYIESSELSEMTDEEVQLARMSEGVKVKGNNPPKPINKWSQGGFSTQVLDVLRDRKYEKPTPIQREALPAILSGRDVVGVAQTGSGKTVAFILPMFRHVKDQPPIANGDGPIAVILAPTRELAAQIHKECKPYLAAYQLRAVAAYGGSDLKTNIADMKRGTEIIVATPGRYIELLTANNGRVTNLNRVTYLVLDEADRMFDMGFEPQIMKIMNNIRPDRQTVLFSATLPITIAGLARKKLNDALEITVGSRSVVAADVTQKIEVRDEESRFARLLGILGEMYYREDNEETVKDRTLVFVERQESADALFLELSKKAYSCVVIHGGRDQIDREDSIKDFKAGIVHIMIATSVAARGLDVQELKLVINYDPPNHLEDYVHRCGRTGRAGNKGTAITFVSENQCKTAPFLMKALKDSHTDIPEALKKLNMLLEDKIKEGKERKNDNKNTGFGGRGVERFSAQREKERAREGKAFDDEGDAVKEEDGADKEKKGRDGKHAATVDQAVAKAMGGGNVQKDGEGGDAAGNGANNDESAHPQRRANVSDNADETVISSNLQSKLDNAMTVEKRVREAEPDLSKLTPHERAMRARQKANAALGATGSARQGASIDNRGPDAGEFHARLEINDFPQRARWSVTNRSNVGRILESTGVSITNKGTHYPPPKEVPEGEAKLYVLVEGDTEIAVENAMRQLTANLKEGYLAALEEEAAKGNTQGRYSVV